MQRPGSDQLITLDRFSTALNHAETFDDITEIQRKAEAVRVWAKNASDNLEVQNRAAELKLRAERKAGALLMGLRLRGGDRKSNGQDDRLKLSDLGITQNQSKRWQREAKVPDDVFEAYVKRAQLSGDEITAAELMRVNRSVKASNRKGPGKDNPRNLGRLNGDIVAPPAKVNRERSQPFYGTADENALTNSLEVIEELRRHHDTLRNMLQPLCTGEQETLQPGQRKGIMRYLSEIDAGLQWLCQTQRAIPRNFETK